MKNKSPFTPEQIELQAYIPPALKQTSVAADELLNSANCGVIVQRSGQVTNEFRNQARECALEICEHTNKTQKGFISSFLYEETFGQQDRIHWFIHLRSLADYMRFHRLAAVDPAFGEIFMRNRAPESERGGDWTTLFSGTFQERVLTPHYWGFNGTHSPQPVPDAESRVALYQSKQPAAQLLHSSNARMIIMRQAQVDFQYRSEARVFARAYADYLNRHLAGYVTCFVYEEHFGAVDRLNWLIHLECYEDYQHLIEFLAQDSGMRDVLTRSWVEGGGSHSDWSRLFVPGSISEVLLCPQHPTKDF